MKKVFALVLAAVMLMSVAAMAEGVASKPGVPTVVSVDPDTVNAAVDANSDAVKTIADGIQEVGMEEAFSSVLDNAADYDCAALVEVSLDGAEGAVVLGLSVPGVTADSEVAVMLGLFDGENVEWSEVEVVSVEDGVVTVSFTAEQVAAIAAGTAVIAILTK